MIDSEKQLNERIDKLENMLSQVLTLLNNAQFEDKNTPCPYTLHSWLDKWYETYKVPILKKGSITEISVCIRNHIKPHIPDKPLNEISGLEIQQALNKINGSRTRKYTYSVLNGAFKQALKLKLIKENVMLSVDTVSHRYKNGTALTKEQQTYFLNLIADNKLRALYEFYILSGCRRSEATELKWTDIDFESKLIYVRGTKTSSSNRVIPLFEPIEKLLSTLPRVSEKVFNCSTNAVRCNFKRLKQKYNLPFRIHDLRHTFATRRLQNGIQMKTIQKWLGHSRFETTSNIYSHVQTDFEREEIAKYK